MTSHSPIRQLRYLGIRNLAWGEGAAAAFQRWTDNITPELVPELKPLLTAIGNWGEEVFAYFEQPITNAYTESVNGLVKTMNRMGRGYSFEAIRARMLYDPKARADGAELVRETAEDSGSSPTLYFKHTSMTRNPPRTRERVVEYGPYIPTLVKLLESGHFEKPAIARGVATI